MKKVIVSVLAVAFGLALSACEVEDVSAGGGADHSQDTSSKYTKSQNNAIKSAHDYLNTAHFSRVGLIQQLSSQAGDGYPRSDAVFAVNHIKVNYRKQAVGEAKDYLDSGSFSRTGLIRQLSSKAGSNFTHAQAVYAVDKVGLK